MTKRTKGESRLNKAQQTVQNHTEEINESIEELEKLLGPYEKIKNEINKLRAAQRALLGGSRTTSEGTTRLRMEDVTAFLRENPGSSPGVIAENFGVTQSTVSSHLYRGKDQRYLSRDGLWYLRDPKNGIRTVDDLKDEDDE